jgi:hypothetical protein
MGGLDRLPLTDRPVYYLSIQHTTAITLFEAISVRRTSWTFPGWLGNAPYVLTISLPQHKRTAHAMLALLLIPVDST